MNSSPHFGSVQVPTPVPLQDLKDRHNLVGWCHHSNVQLGIPLYATLKHRWMYYRPVDGKKDGQIKLRCGGW